MGASVAVSGRGGVAVGGGPLVGGQVAIYLPMMPGGESPSRPSVAVHNPTAQGPVEPAKASAPAAATATAPVAPSPTPAPAAVPAPAPAPISIPDSAPVSAPAPVAAPAPEAASGPAPAPTAEPAFRVQVGAFRETERARALSRRLTRAGFPTSIERGTTPDGNTIYRVRTRQALPRGEAQQLVARLRHRVPALRPILVPGGKAAG